MPITGQPIELSWFVPEHFHNVWTMVAFALVASTVLKGIFDYLGTYLANYAGFGMVTDLRNELYTATLRRSVAFFQKYSTGTLLSAIVNDIDRVQYALSTVLAEFLQQFFTFLFTAVRGDPAGRTPDLGAGHLRSRRYHGGAGGSASVCAPPPATARTSWPRSRTSCRRPSPASAS